MFRRVFLISALLLLTGLSALAEDWPCFHRSPDRTGLSSETLVPPLVVAWQFQTGGAVSSSPAIVGGTVYFGSYDGKVYALDAATGAKKWEYATGGWIGSSPYVSNGVVFITSSDGYLYALYADTGALKWSYYTGGSDVSSPVVSDGMVIWGSGYPNKSTYAVTEASGTYVWKGDTNQMVYSSGAVSGTQVVIGSDDAYYRCYNKTTGSLIWQFLTSGGIYRSVPAISGNTVYFAPGDWDRKIYAVDLATGAQRWTFTVPQTYWQTNSYVSTAAVDSDTVYFVGGCPTQKVFALDSTTGAKRWDHYIGDTSSAAYASSPAVSGGLVYVASANGRVYALDRSTGAEVWSIPVGSSILSSVAISNGALYVGDEDGKLSCITLQTFTSPTNYVQPGWNLVSMPGEPLNADPAVVFSPVDVSNSSFQYWKNNTDGGGFQSYGALFGWTGPVQMGVPYWFQESVGPKTLSYKGYARTTDQQISIPAHASAPYWIMIGQPFEHSTPCSSILFSSTSHPIPLPWAEAYNAAIVESNAQGFEANSFFSTGPEGFMVERNYLQPWYGYWLLIRTTEPVTITFPVAARVP